MSHAHPSIESLSRHRQLAVEGWGLSSGTVLIPSGLPVPIAGTDGFHDFHAHPEHFWLAGTEEPGQVLAFDPGEGFTLFVHVPSPAERVWEGAGEEPDAVRHRIGIDDVRDRSELEAWLGRRRSAPIAVIGNRDLLGNPAGYGAPELGGPGFAVDEELSARLSGVVTAGRRVKDAGEIGQMKLAAAATTRGHLAGMRAARPGMTERAVGVEIEAAFRRGGGRRTAYPSIVGSGPNAAVLHYAPGERRIESSDLVLVDAGAEVAHYMCDVTRTWPAGADFTPLEADIYDLVLTMQEEAIAKARPGKEYRELHLEACVTAARGLVDLGILRGDPESLVERDAHALFFPHGIGHMIGLVTHDAGGYAEGREPSDRFGLCWLRTDLPLAEGHVVTIEPGIYFVPALLTDPERRREFADAVDFDRVDGMLGFGGVRIEDDVHVTADGHEVLTSAIPKARADVVTLRAEALR